jgi:hypothetical protein
MIKQIIIFALLIGLASAGTYTMGDTYIKGILNVKNATALNSTTVSYLQDSGKANVAGALTTTTTAKIGGAATVNSLMSNGTANIAGALTTSTTAKVGGAATVQSLSSNTTVAVSSADGLTVNSIIVPQKKDFNIKLTPNSLNGSEAVLDAACVITSIKSEVDTVGTYSAGNISCQILKLTGTNLATTTSPGPISCLASGQSINLKDTPGTVRTNTLNATTGSITLAAGDRLGIKFNNQLTGLTGCITITMRRA